MLLNNNNETKLRLIPLPRLAMLSTPSPAKGNLSYKITKFLLILWLCPLFFGNVLANPSNSVVLEATAKGDTQEEAINNALSLLSQQVYVSLQNTTVITETMADEDFSTSMANNTILTSNGYFQNVSIATKKLSKNSYEAHVSLSRAALANTINYLFMQLLPEKIVDSSSSKLREQLDRANFLFSLINYAQANNVSFQSSDINLREYIADLRKILSADSQLRFLISPQNINAEISIDKNIYKNDEKIYLARKKYTYKITSSGYKPVVGEITMRQGDNITLDIFMQKQLDSVVPVRVKIINNTALSDSLLKDNLQFLLADYQMKAVDNSTNSMEISLNQRNEQSVIKGWTNQIIEATIKSNIDGVSAITQFSINNLVQENNSKISPSSFIKQFNPYAQKFFARLFD
ncbi:MAG: hypothetical protein LBQ34_03530 [Alphaproteobacteria bacterium]|jgi:hypothetical protein|nr:hypothetical protein [Alphaproteobacteria bacterium]